MKLTQKDKELFLRWGFKFEDLRQIEEACSKSVYTLNNKKISRKRTLEILGREVYLSGIARSAFHYSCVRQGINGENVFFDSSKLFD